MIDIEIPITEEVKQNWLYELRSGRREQVRGSLSMPTSQGLGYCCLGVLCRAMSKTEEYHWLSTKRSELFQKLVKMNDDECKSFKEIADYLEETL